MSKENWAETTLDQIVISKKGKKPAILKAEEFKKSLPYIDIEAFETGKIKQYADYETSSHCVKTDVLVVWDGARFGLTGTNQIGAIGSTLACLTPVLIESSYLHKFIQRHYATIQQKPKGMATPHVDPDVFWNLEFPLPPLPEQKRIVKKLDSILPKVKILEERLDKIPRILKRFRQSVLAVACSGRLTEDWRDVDVEDNDNYPSNWKLVILDDVAEIKGGVTKGRDLGKFKTIKLPYLRVANVQDGFLDLSEIKFIEIKREEKEKYILKKNDLLFTEGGDRDKLGRGTVWNEEIKDCIHQNHIFRARIVSSEVSPIFVSLISRSQKSKDYFFENGKQTVNLASINITELKNLPVPLPPFKEQNEIVRRVEKLFKLADSLEAKYVKAMERVEKIEQSVLAKAFRGELAEQDPNDEPAEELLKRILAEKAKLESENRKSKRKTKSR